MVGKYVLIYEDDEWDVAKVESSVDDSQLFRYKMQSTDSWVYGSHSFDAASHGRSSPAAVRWVLLK
jgi:hypothetical protein